MVNYQQKYFRYKSKYLKLRSHQKGGGGDESKLLVFDFDQTMTSVHVSSNLKQFVEGENKDKIPDQFVQKLVENLGDIRSQLFKNDDFLNKLRNFSRSGNTVGLASYGYKNVIEYFLKIQSF